MMLKSMRDLWRLGRFDRPAGIWLLWWPCAWGLALTGVLPDMWRALVLFGVGATAMRAAGCVWNDVLDRELDAQVLRTRDRPVASGAVSVRAALLFAGGLCLVGLAVVLRLRPLAAWVAVAALALVAAYPLMKRITWWPQAWLGLTFNWGVLVAWAQATGEIGAPALWLYAAGVAWTLGYDTIYALQDLEDDALAGVKSSARRLGGGVRRGVALFYAATVLLAAAAVWSVRPDPLALLALGPAAVQLAWQAARLRPGDPANALRLFKSNRDFGALLFAGLWVAGSA